MKWCVYIQTAKKVGIDFGKLLIYVVLFVLVVSGLALALETFPVIEIIFNWLIMVMLGGLVCGLGILIALHIKDRYNQALCECGIPPKEEKDENFIDYMPKEQK